MKVTCDFPSDEYGTMILSGQVCHESETAALESILTFDGEELLVYHNGNPVGFSRADIKEMETALVYRGEPENRVKPSPEMVAFVRAATIRPKHQFLQDRSVQAAKENARRRKMPPWDGKEEPNFQVETPWDGKE